ncbi:MAG: CoA transferase [Xanthomonadales bacterium]|nr:CoA transferase [Xanthomonadales bacterium]
MSRALDGIRVLDLTHMLSGPFGAMLLADLGAETIKVEPLEGEGTRRWCERDPELSIDGMGVYFMTLNRNKHSISVDLKSPDGQALFQDLVRCSDVVISNFGPGVAQRLGVDAASLRAVNPRIVSCSISGYGSDGPAFDRASFDLVAQAASGMMSVTGENADRPLRTGTPIADIGGGLYAALGILAALVERDRSGEGQHVDISMLDCQLSLLSYLVSMAGFTGRDPAPMGNAHSVHVPYNSYRTADGFIVIAVLTDRFWQNLKEALACDELDRPEFDTQPGRVAARELIDAHIGKLLATRPSAHWLDRLAAHRVPAGPVNTITQAMEDPQVVHRNMIVDLAHPNGETRKGPGNPVKLSRSGGEAFAPAPELGTDTERILAEVLGLNADQVDGLKQKGVVRGRPG